MTKLLYLGYKLPQDPKRAFSLRHRPVSMDQQITMLQFLYLALGTINVAVSEINSFFNLREDCEMLGDVWCNKQDVESFRAYKQVEDALVAHRLWDTFNWPTPRDLLYILPPESMADGAWATGDKRIIEQVVVACGLPVSVCAVVTHMWVA
jgi:hypothetical protein